MCDVVTNRAGDRWENRQSGSDQVLGSYTSRSEAREAGALVAKSRHVDHVVIFTASEVVPPPTVPSSLAHFCRWGSDAA